MRVLARGLKFRPTLPEISVFDILTPTENVIIKLKIEISQAVVLRNTNGKNREKRPMKDSYQRRNGRR